jgi:hypothetical protein
MPFAANQAEDSNPSRFGGAGHDGVYTRGQRGNER